tara:strand:- start:600 stop:2375 length:1776 start_codon:yes stop_codon:yes gene_type:complete
MKYPKNYLEEIKLRLKVSQVVGKKIKLKRRGKEFVGLSPFTNEKTPSFTVSDEKGFYHCFSSGEHGNIFDFLMKTQSLKFGEAVRQLAAEAGMQPYKFTNFDLEKEKRYQMYKNILKDYSDHHHKILFENNSSAMDYLKKRGIGKDAISEFKIGFVPDNSDYYRHLSKKFNEQEILQTGLFYKNEKYNKFINRFHSRIIFPIKNIVGDVIAFGGRIINNGKIAKYINSPETEFYKKGRQVFNLDKAKSISNKDGEVILVEGYMDVVTLYSYGIKNVVSNQGTALTENQINLIWKFFNYPIICLDGDQSGQKASLRIAENLFSFIKENNKIGFVMLPNKLDPDDYIKEKGNESFQKLVKSNLSIQEFIWRMYLNHLDRSDPFAVSKFEKKIKSLCYSVRDETLRKYLLEDYLEKIKNLTPLQKGNKKFSRQIKNNQRILNETKKISVAKDHLTKEEIKEYSALYVMYNYPEIISPRLAILEDITFSSKSLNKIKSEILGLISRDEFSGKNITDLNKKYSNLIEDVNQNSVIKNIFLKKNQKEQIELLNEILKDLNDIKFSKKIDELENKLMKKFDEKSFSDLMELKSHINKE